MSLHRVSSMTSYEHVRGSSPARSEHRYMSFNPAHTRTQPILKEGSSKPTQTSRPKRILQVICAILYCLLSTGIVFGYAAIKPVLLEEGVYREYCSLQDNEQQGEICDEQEIRLNLMFTTAAVATNVCALPVGAVLDKYGPRVSGVTGSALIAIGALLLGFGTLLPFDSYLPGYTLLALGGPFVFISSFQLSNAFPNHSGLILALLTGAFDSSSAIFLFYRLLYNASNRAFTPEIFFLAYLIVPVTMILVQLFIMPSKSYETVGELMAHAENLPHDAGNFDRTGESAAGNPEMASLLGHTVDDQNAKKEERKKAISGVWGVMHGRSALQQIRSPWFILITMFTVVQMTRINYFVATIRTQYNYLLDNKLLAEHVNNVFDIALPFGGVVSVPFIGLILDNTSTPFVLGLLVVIGTTIGVLGVLSEMWAAYLNVGVFVLYRPFYYTAVSDYTAKVFGFHTFGKVYGLIICLAGLLNFSQSALDAMTHKVFHRNPVPVNMLMLGIALTVGLALAGFVWYKSKSMARKYLETEAEDATEIMMPGAIEDGI